MQSHSSSPQIKFAYIDFVYDCCSYHATQEITQKMAKKLTSSTKELMIALGILLAITWITHSDKIPDFDLIVAQDGSGDLTTITDVIFAAPNFSLTRYRIKIRAGTYKENIVIGREKQNLTLIGDGMDKTIIMWRKGFDDVNSTSLTATVGELVIQKGIYSRVT
jgi:pectin methylesterase-like acyl-CoA thioesterase